MVEGAWRRARPAKGGLQRAAKRIVMVESRERNGART